MRNNSVTKTLYPVILILLLSFSLVSSLPQAVNSHDSNKGSTQVAASSDDAIRPIVRQHGLMDKDLDGIQDSLEAMISQAVTNKSSFLPVVVTFYNSVLNEDLELFVMLGGRVTHVYRYVTYGFAGVIPAANISKFATLEKGKLSIIEHDSPMRCHLDVSTPLLRVRPVVWETYGYMGSSSESIAIIDTGIDDSHPDVGPYGDLDFSRKIVGWYDASADDALAPQDFGEHGTHVAGIAAGTGVSNTLQGFGELGTTFTYILPPEKPGPLVYGYVDYIDILSPGVIELNCSWGDANDVLLVLSSPAGEVRRMSGTSQPLLLTYDTSGTSHPTGRYEVFVGNVDGPSGTPFSCLETFPYQGLNDGNNLFAGVAPNSKLVGVKVFDNTGSGTLSTVMAGMEWIIENRITYNITVASMSVGLENGATDTTLDEKADTMVASGIVTVVSAGNDFPEYTIGSPGTAAYVITVGGTNDQDGIASYSSNGDTAKNEYELIKPDVVAPGGTFDPQFGNKIVSVDSNDVDAAYTGYADRNADDYQQMAGTSMSTPHVSGLAALLIQAFGSWSWAKDEVFKIKMILSMTAFETQKGEGLNQPSLDRGLKDSKEGYGRICADAAIEAMTMTYDIGDAASDVFGFDPFDKKVWARQVSLSAGTQYEFHLSVPASADFDLYLYDLTPDAYGQPIILERSVQPSTDAEETITYVPTESGNYYIVAKWVSGDGTFNLTSSYEVHDVAVIDVIPSVSVATQREVVAVDVVVENQGEESETFDVELYANSSLVDSEWVSLASGSSTMLSFSWNTTDFPGRYVLSATATAVPGEGGPNLEDNTFVDGTVRVNFLGDVDGDGDVGLADFAMMLWAYDTTVGDDHYDAKADFDNDGDVDLSDLYWVLLNYGQVT